MDMDSLKHSRALEDEVAQLTELLKKSQAEKVQFETKWSESQMRAEDVEDKLFSREAQNRALHEQITLFRQEQLKFEAVQEDYENIKMLNVDLESELEDMQMESDKLRNDFEDREIAFQSELECQTPRIGKQEVEELVKQLRERLENAQTNCELLVQQDRMQKTRIEELEMSLTDAQDQVSQWEEEVVIQNMSNPPEPERIDVSGFEPFSPSLRNRRRKKNNSVSFPISPKTRDWANEAPDSDEKTIKVSDDVVTYSPVGSLRSLKTFDSLSMENFLMSQDFVESCRGSVVFRDSRRASIELDMSRRMPDLLEEAKSCLDHLSVLLTQGNTLEGDSSMFSNLLDEFGDVSDQGAVVETCEQLTALLEQIAEKHSRREKEVASDISELSALAEDKQCKIKLLCKDIYDREEGAKKESDSFGKILRDCLDRAATHVTKLVVPL